MSYRKYFKNEQKLRLRPISGEQENERVETLTAFLLKARGDSCDLRLPYDSRPGEEFPFVPGMEVELIGEALGLGVRITGNFDHYLKSEQVRINLNQTLEVFQRRGHPRQDVKVGLRYTKGHGALRTFRQQWKKNVVILNGANDLKKLGAFPRCQVNLSQSGLRFAIKPPVQVADLCMVLLELEPETPPVCALGEVVWTTDTGEEQSQDSLQVGMQFINILKNDQKRIDNFLARSHPQSPAVTATTGN